ncbi:sulfotransferase family protein [Virgibacillus sp. MSP4-1]|uniref:sulfotransferase family protein n=1 Tax=Virgibacillus sp. MSP4-1 TaxID=2700081 RepID=UPI0003A0EF78|nr:sulfotransferase family protein [Virgibacillus sp. MSP4-1]QHS23287.1 sulfotransferase family protein [Virgibacillus sp. MSP4-1]
MNSINVDINPKLKVPLRVPVLHYLGGVDPNLEWQVRTVAAHKPPEKKDQEKLEQQKKDAEHFIQTEEGIKSVKQFAAESSKVFQLLISNPNKLMNEYLENKKFIFITGAMRTGGTFLEKKIFEAFNLDLSDYSLHIVHDSVPHEESIRNSFKTPSLMFTLFELAQFLVWAKREFKHSDVIIKKRTAFELSLPLLYSIFGNRAEYIVTLRHPVPAGYSMAKKRNYNVESYDSPEWWYNLVKQHKCIGHEQWDNYNYLERFILYWQASYEKVARNKLSEQNLRFITYNQSDYSYHVNEIADKFNGNKVDFSDFNVIKKNYNKVWSDKLLNDVLTNVSNQWEMNDMKFPNLELV